MSQINPSETVIFLPEPMPAKRKRTRKKAAATAPVPKRMRPSEVRLLEAERGVRIVCGPKLWDTLLRRSGIAKMAPLELLQEPLQAFLKEIEDESSAFVANFDALLEKQMESLIEQVARSARPQETHDVTAAAIELVSSGEVHETFSGHSPVAVASPESQNIPEAEDLELASGSEVAERRCEQAPAARPSPATEEIPNTVASPTARIRPHWRDLLEGIRKAGRRTPLTD